MFTVVCFNESGTRREYKARGCKSSAAACAVAVRELSNMFGGRWVPSCVL